MTVKRQANRVWIEGLPSPRETTGKYPLLVREVKTCTFAGALEAALSVTERLYSYEEILALSGIAFRTRWYEDTDASQWTPAMRLREQQMLTQCVEFERAAVEAMHEAVPKITLSNRS
jgi:hypothetical protein